MKRKLTTGSKNFDIILGGGFPENTISLLGGPAGIGKRVLAHQLLFSNIKEDERGIYCTTVSGSVNRIIRHIQDIGFFEDEKISSNIIYEDAGELLIKEGLAKFIDFITYQLQHASLDYLVIDGFEAFIALAPSNAAYQKFVYELLGVVGAYSCNTIFTGTYSWDVFEKSFEMHSADQVIWLDWEKERPPHHRSVKVCKWIDGAIMQGKHTFTIGEQGLRVFPRFTVGKTGHKSDGIQQVMWGDALLDTLSGGGVQAGSSSILYGDANTGKTLTGLRFIKKGVVDGEPGAVISFQEDQADLYNHCAFIGWNIKESVLKKEAIATYISPIDADLDELALKIMQIIREINAKRLFLNDISYLGRFFSGKQNKFLEFLYTLQKFLKNAGVTSIWTYPAMEIQEEMFLTSVMDNVILFKLQRAEREKNSRWIEIIKVRGKQFNSMSRSFEITADGLLECEALPAQAPIKK